MFIEPFSQTLLTYQKTNLFPLALPDSTLLTFRKRSPTVPLKGFERAISLKHRKKVLASRSCISLLWLWSCENPGRVSGWKQTWSIKILWSHLLAIFWTNIESSHTCHKKKMLSFRCQVTACMESHKNMHSNAWKRHWCLCFPLMWKSWVVDKRELV